MLGRGGALDEVVCVVAGGAAASEVDAPAAVVVVAVDGAGGMTPGTSLRY